MKNPNQSYSALRALSCICIVICHILYSLNIVRPIALYLSGVFVDVFIILSAYLLGRKYVSSNRINTSKFLNKRLIKLLPTYYIYLFFCFVFIISVAYFHDHSLSLSIKQIISHILLLNWIIPGGQIEQYPLPQLGHLWFMTLIFLCYLTVTIFDKFPFFRNTLLKPIKFNLLISIFIITWILQCIFYGKFQQLGACIIGFLIVFYRGGRIENLINVFNPKTCYFIFIVLNITLIIWYISGMENFLWLNVWLNLLVAISWIITFPKIFNDASFNKETLFISSISFEVYLIHHPLIIGRFSLFKYLHPLVATLVIFVITIICAFILNKICVYITRVAAGTRTN